MSEYVLILYPILLLGYLMLAARWQPKGATHPSQREAHTATSRRQERHGR